MSEQRRVIDTERYWKVQPIVTASMGSFELNVREGWDMMAFISLW